MKSESPLYKMRVCLVHNAYGQLSGEEVAVKALGDCLTSRGHAVIPFFRSSADLDGRQLAKIGVFFTGVYNATARKQFARMLDTERPDVVHIHNLFPLISPSILDETRCRDIPTVMTLHNYRLLCPTGLMFSHGEVCHRCLGGREWWCTFRNCTGEWPKSAGYALRNAVARIRRSFLEGVDRFIALTEFAKSMLVRNGYPAERIDVVRNIVNLEGARSDSPSGDYVGYVGRISREKGVDTIVESARECPEIKFRFAGHYQRMPDLPRRASKNCEFLGQLPATEVSDFVSTARFMVFASQWYEMSPLSLVDGMLHGKTVICSALGGLPEFVDDGSTGLMFAPGEPHDLAEKIRYLWERPDLCRQMGEAGRTKILVMFSQETNYARLLNTYHAALKKLDNVDAESKPAIP